MVLVADFKTILFSVYSRLHIEGYIADMYQVLRTSSTSTECLLKVQVKYVSANTSIIVHCCDNYHK